MAFSGAGAGTEGDPYIITDVDELQEMNDELDAWYELGGDIDAAETSTWNGGEGFVPVGPKDTPFTGSFDGGNFTISDLCCNRPLSQYQGMFGKILNSGDIKDVNLIDVDITGFRLVGGLAGWGATINISGIAITGVVTCGSYAAGGMIGYCAGTVTSCNTDVEVSAVGSKAGGLAGQSTADITLCYALGSVEGTYYVGGLVGDGSASSTKTISKSFATGNVTGIDPTHSYYVGGLLGAAANHRHIENCYANGTVLGGSSTTNDDLGGLCGDLYNNTCAITNCWSGGRVKGYKVELTYVGGLLGRNRNSAPIADCFWNTITSGVPTSAGGTGKITSEMVKEVTFTNWDFSTVWGIIEGKTYPYLLDIPFPIRPKRGRGQRKGHRRERGRGKSKGNNR